MKIESISEYIDTCRDLTRATSDSNLAMKIGVSRQLVAQWRKGRALPSDDLMVTLAKRAKLDPDEALILLNLWRSHGDAKARYARMLKKFSAIITLVLFLSSPLASTDANALSYNEFLNTEASALRESGTYNFAIIYIIQCLAKLLHWIRCAHYRAKMRGPRYEYSYI